MSTMSQCSLLVSCYYVTLLCLISVITLTMTLRHDITRNDVIATSSQSTNQWTVSRLNLFNGSRPITEMLGRSMTERCLTSTTLIIIVCSAVENTSRRAAIRHSWGNMAASQFVNRKLTNDKVFSGEEVQLFFLVGRMSSDHSNDVLQAQLDVEMEREKDVLQANFVDSYSNLTLKSLVMLHWTRTNCPGVRYLVKCDDDVFINTPLLMRDLINNVHTQFIMGRIIAYAQPIRVPTAKWYTPRSVYNHSVYPTYASGAAYLISGDVIGKLYDEGVRDRRGLFWIEDVYVTGLLARRVGVELIHNGKFDGYKELTSVCDVTSHIVLHRVTEEQLQLLWSVVNGSYTGCN